ncbi:hypothetical protein [Burkholderia catarinensis]|uniref:hypothetical protein n=1 Tax=Burkholderia catarinensis TaxID=1108140 RepID=UPI0009121960|nr:hypothetical protein [Burkholderia catarinensis]KAG8152355.1 hypothetical protein BFF94_016615 [Burkholderia catarinensis]
MPRRVSYLTGRFGSPHAQAGKSRRLPAPAEWKSTQCKAEFGHTPKETLECAAAPVLLPCDPAADRWADGGRLAGWTLPFGVLNN